MATTIKLRRDTAANWTSVNPVLADGESGYEKDTGRIKIGDGTTAWNSLPYILESVKSYANLAAFPATGLARTIYIAEDTGLLYRWDGSEYVGVGGSGSGGGTAATQTEVNEEENTTAFVNPKTLSEKPVYKESYTSTQTFTKRSRDTYVEQSGNIVLDADFTDAKHGAEKVIFVNGDNANTLTFTSKYEKVNNGLDFDNTKLNHIYCTYNSYAEKVYYNIIHTSRLVDDLTPPSIISSNLQGANKYVDMTFNEGVYSNNDGTGGLTASDLALSFFQNSGTATACVISSVKRNDSSIEGSASALVGGETTVRIFLSITGNTNGNEYITINIASNSSVYDAAGNAMSSTQGTSNLTLNAADVTSPIITGYQLAANNSYVDVLFSEGIYTDVALNPPLTTDFLLTFAQNGGAASAASIASITTTAGGALGGGESTIRFNLSITGTPTGTETITITPVSGSALYDQAGNAMASGQTTGTITLANNSYSSDASAVFARMSGSLTPSLKNAMAAFIDSQVASGNWAKIEEFQFYGMDTQVNSLIGWKGNANGSITGAVWNSGSNFQFDGVDDYLNTGFTPSAASLITQNDMFLGAYVKEWGHAAGVTKVLFGGQDGTRFAYLAQGSTNQLNRTVNSSSAIAGYATETVFSNESHYGIARTVSTTSLLYKNGSQIDSDSQTSNGLPTRSIYLAARNSSGTADLHANCKLSSFVAAQATGFDFANFYTNLSTLISNVGA